MRNEVPEFIGENSENSEISRRELLTLAWCRADVTGGEAKGNVTLARARCTGCGLCTVDCLAGALTISSNGTDDAFQLRFRPDSCNACGRCVSACPEKCLTLEHVLKPGAGNAVVLFEDRVVRCRRCGGIIGPQAMVAKIRATMQAAGQTCSQLDLCPDCKARSQFNFNMASPVRKG